MIVCPICDSVLCENIYGEEEYLVIRNDGDNSKTFTVEHLSHNGAIEVCKESGYDRLQFDHPNFRQVTRK